MLHQGDGLRNERIANLTLRNNSYNTSSLLDVTNTTDYFTVGNTSSIDVYTTIQMSDEDLRGDISKNPDLYMYQGVQIALFFAFIMTGAVKGYLTIYT